MADEGVQPFWSFDGGVLYYLQGTARLRARRIDPLDGVPQGDPFTAFAVSEWTLPTWLPGSTPVATPNTIVFVLADVPGDVWLVHLEPDA